MKRLVRIGALVFGLSLAVGLSAPTTAHAQVCPALHVADYAPAVDKRCGQWGIQRMDRVNPHFGPDGWELDDHGKRYILVANYDKSTPGDLNYEYFQTIDRALLVDNADLRIGKARPLRDDRVDADLEENAIGLYLEDSYARALGVPAP